MITITVTSVEIIHGAIADTYPNAKQQQDGAEYSETVCSLVRACVFVCVREKERETICEIIHVYICIRVCLYSFKQSAALNETVCSHDSPHKTSHKVSFARILPLVTQVFLFACFTVF